MSETVLICGSRGWTDIGLIFETMQGLAPGTYVLVGDAQGADFYAYHYAQDCGLAVSRYEADWKRHGKRAGILRNLEMLDAGPDRVIAFHMGDSRGTAHTIREARKRGLPVEVHRAS